MKTFKLLVALSAASLFSAAFATAQEAPKSEAKKAGCCMKSEKDGKACAHACCEAAAKDGKNCEKCGGKNERKV